MNAFTTLNADALSLSVALAAHGACVDLMDTANEDISEELSTAAGETLATAIALPSPNLAGVLEKVKALSAYFAGGTVDVNFVSDIQRDLERLTISPRPQAA